MSLAGGHTIIIFFYFLIATQSWNNKEVIVLSKLSISQANINGIIFSLLMVYYIGEMMTYYYYQR